MHLPSPFTWSRIQTSPGIVRYGHHERLSLWELLYTHLRTGNFCEDEKTIVIFIISSLCGSREMDERCAHAFPVTHWTTYARWLQTWIITDTQFFFSFFEDDHQYFRYIGHVTRRVANQIELVMFHLLSVMVNELWRRQHYGIYTGQRSTMAAHRCTKRVHVTRASCINM